MIIRILLACLIATMALPASAQEDDEINKHVRIVQDIIAINDIYKAAQYINNLDMPEKSAAVYDAVIKDYYWQKKDIDRVIELGRAGIQYLLLETDRFRSTDSQRGYELKKEVKALAYNLASFCWPGWNEPGVSLSQYQIKQGFQAARLNVRLAEELAVDGLSLSVDYWMLGAQYLAVQQYQKARGAFTRQKTIASEAGDKINELLADGYIGIANIIEGNAEGQDMLGKAIKGLSDDGSEDARFYIEQFNTVLDIFIKK